MADPNPVSSPDTVYQTNYPSQDAVAPVADPFDEQKLLNLFEGLKKEATEYRWIWEREWLRDLYYAIGRQWIFFSPTRREWVDKRLAKWVPRPVTNKMAEVIQTIRSNFASINLEVTVRPIGASAKSIAAAEVADKMSPLLNEEHKMPSIMKEADWWFITCGNSCLQVSWDNDVRFNRVFVPSELCVACGTISQPQAIVNAENACPNCKGIQFIPAKGEDGEPEGQDVSFGKGKTTALSPFEYAIPSNITRWDDLPYIIRLRWRDKHYYEANNPELVGRISWQKSPNDRSLQLFKSLALTNDLGTGSQFAYLGAAGSHTVEGCTEYELWMKPTPEYPDGLLMRVVGDQDPILLKQDNQSIPGPFPYKDIQGNPLFPFVHAQYEHMGGRLWGRSALSPLIQKQDQLNQLDSLIQLIVQRMANPVWLIPENAGVEHFTGEPGLVMKWNALAANGQAKPERIAGEDVPVTLYQLREQLLSDIEQLSGCLTGDTKIPCLDGKTRTMQELSEQYPEGGMWVYGFDCESMRIVPSFVEKAWSTGVQSIVRVSFQEGTHIDCTADHPFLTYDRGYVRSDELRVDEAIVPLIIHEAPMNVGTKYKKEYLQITQPVDRKTEPVHRMVAYKLLGLTRGQSYLDIHHIDKNERNNLPDNLQVLTRREHILLEPRPPFVRLSGEEYSAFSKKRWAGKTKAKRLSEVSPMLDGMHTYWDSLSAEEKAARNKKGWETKFSQMSLAERAEMGQRQSERMKKYWAGRREAKTADNRDNHRVLSVVALGKAEVFDLTTSTQNFGTSAGVFVHNTFDILKGQKPSGVEAFSALQLLVERSQSRFTSAYQARGEMYRGWFVLALELERQFGPTSRTMTMIGSNRGYTFRHFENAQLQGQLAVQVEDGSTMPKTNLGKRAAIEQASQMQLLNPQDPDQKYALLSQFGLSDLVPSLNIHVQAALQIQDAFERWLEAPNGPPPLVVKPWFDPLIHFNERIKWCNSDKMREVMQENPQVEMLVTEHLMQLQMLIPPPPGAEESGAPAPGPKNHEGGPNKAPGGGAGKAMSNSNQNSSATRMTPAGAAPGSPI